MIKPTRPYVKDEQYILELKQGREDYRISRPDDNADNSEYIYHLEQSIYQNEYILYLEKRSRLVAKLLKDWGAHMLYLNHDKTVLIAADNPSLRARFTYREAMPVWKALAMYDPWDVDEAIEKSYHECQPVKDGLNSYQKRA